MFQMQHTETIFSKQHSETVTVWNYQNADCRLKKLIYCVIYYNFRQVSFRSCSGLSDHKVAVVKACEPYPLRGSIKSEFTARELNWIGDRYTSFPLNVQRLLVPSVRQQVAKPQVLTRSQQNCSKQEERRYWTECTQYVWRSGKLASGQRNGRSPRSSHFPRKVILNSVQIIEQLLLSPTQARSFFGSYWRGSE